MYNYVEVEDKYKPVPEGEEFPEDAYAEEHLKRAIAQLQQEIVAYEDRKGRAIRDLSSAQELQVKAIQKQRKLKSTLDTLAS